MSESDSLILDLLVKVAMLDKKGGEFEKFFTAAAIELWGDDFEPWKPQGRLGDFKCDGYRISTKTVFQCNAPEQFVAHTVASKIENDFVGALDNFGDRMKTWIFVHNQAETPSRALDLLHKLRGKHPDIELRVWTSSHLAREIRSLSDAAKRNLFPGSLSGNKVSEEMEQFIACKFGQSHPPLPEAMAQPQPSNRNEFNEAMDKLGDIDREVRRRLLGYSRWLDPAPKSEVNGRITSHGFTESVIAVNAKRLQDEKLLIITENHYLAAADSICQQAAETVMDEFLAELDS